MLVPLELETSRLILRQFRESDWMDLHQYFVDEVATKFTVARPFSVGDTWRTLSSMVGHWQIRGYGPYAVQEKCSGKVLGSVGFWYPNDFPGPEIKWSLAREYWGRGLASEAARQVQQVGQRYLSHISLCSLIHPDNTPSIHLALALGACYEQEVELREHTLHLYRHPHPKHQ